MAVPGPLQEGIPADAPSSRRDEAAAGWYDPGEEPPLGDWAIRPLQAQLPEVGHVLVVERPHAVGVRQRRDRQARANDHKRPPTPLRGGPAHRRGRAGGPRAAHARPRIFRTRLRGGLDRAQATQVPPGRRPGRSRRIAIRHDRSPARGTQGRPGLGGLRTREERLHDRAERRDLPGGRRQRLRQRVLHPLPALRPADLRDPWEPRLVRRVERIHVPPLRRRAAGDAAARQHPSPPGRAPPAGALAAREQARPGPPRPGTCRSAPASTCCASATSIPTPTRSAGPSSRRPTSRSSWTSCSWWRSTRASPGQLDAEQGEWLLRISARPKPKVLLTGKPIWVNNEYRRGEIAWGDERRSC